MLLLNTVEEQQELIHRDPMSFFITDHYAGYPTVLVRPTESALAFRELLELSWRRVARKSDIAVYEGKT